MKVSLKVIKYYIDGIKDELKGALEYAEKYVCYKKENPSWAKMYADMANAELMHASYLQTMGDEHISDLSWVPQDDRDAWNSCLRCAAEKMGMVKLMLSK